MSSKVMWDFQIDEEDILDFTAERQRAVIEGSRGVKYWCGGSNCVKRATGWFRVEVDGLLISFTRKAGGVTEHISTPMALRAWLKAHDAYLRTGRNRPAPGLQFRLDLREAVVIGKQTGSHHSPGRNDLDPKTGEVRVRPDGTIRGKTRERSYSRHYA